MRSTRLIVNRSRLKHNIFEFKAMISPNADIMAVVKANAYGHGMVEIARLSLEYGASWLGVATPEEGALLRNNGITAPILVLGAANDDELGICVKHGLHQAIFDVDQAVELNNIAREMGKTALVHVKVNTGMNRIGISNKECFVELLKVLSECESICADGIFTHFACADDINDTRTEKQIELFEEYLAIAKQMGKSFYHVHACNTAGTLRGLCKNYDMVRLGIGIYGYYPSLDMKPACNGKLLPIARLVTNISAINGISKGDAISYGGIFVADGDMRVATLPVGYADGYDRKLSDVGHVVICGKKARILGRICMDQMMVDVTHIPEAVVGSEAVLMGDVCGCFDADDIAEICGTISYEVLTSLSRRVERVYVTEEE